MASLVLYPREMIVAAHQNTGTELFMAAVLVVTKTRNNENA